MVKRIFLSYRREDCAGEAGRLSDRMRHEFGDGCLFMDVDGIRLGVDFVKKLTQEVTSCDVLLAMIGPRWTDLRDERGNRRLDDPSDFVRIEISTALQRDITVIPILLDGTKIPRANLLPDDLKPLAVRHGLDLRNNSFHADLDRLVRELKEDSLTNAATSEGRRVSVGPPAPLSDPTFPALGEVVAGVRKFSRARVVASVFASIVGLIVAGLILPFGETLDKVCEFFPCPSRYAWVDSNPVTVSKYIKSKTTFEMPSLKQADPAQSPRRYVPPPTASCAATESNAWKLKDGTIILENDPLLIQGWVSPSWVGQPEPPDWSRFDGLAKAKFGWTPGFANNRCSAGARCKISPEEIKNQSTPVRITVDRCNSMYMGHDANYAPDGTSMTISILGEADTESLWSVVVPTQTYQKVPLWSSVHIDAGTTK